MIKQTRLQIENRIALLSARPTDNTKIITKLRRQLRKLDKE